ncbi:MAG: hypothetical protein HY812_12780 [Planctomycetes bacterium]|nr:hypothetical protein [Planctomycetota bacterium]
MARTSGAGEGISGRERPGAAPAPCGAPARRRTALLGLALCALLLPACGARGLPPEDTAALARAVALQEQGDFEGAAAAYRSLLRISASREVQARAELGLARVEHGLEQRDLALNELLELAEQSGGRPLEWVERRIHGVSDDFAETAFAEEVRRAAAAAVNRAREKAEENREIQGGAVLALIDRGEFTGALEYLRELEGKRPLADRRDIAELLVRVRLRSDEDAARVLAEFRTRQEQDREAAVLFLDKELERFRGTRAYAGLLEAMLEAGPRPPRSAKEEGGGGEGDGKN